MQLSQVRARARQPDLKRRRRRRAREVNGGELGRSDIMWLIGHYRSALEQRYVKVVRDDDGLGQRGLLSS